MDFQNQDDVSRLANAVHESRQRLKPFREHRLERIREFVGKHYSDDGTKDRRPMNMLSLAIGIYAHRLVSADPRVKCSSRQPGLKASALEREVATNDLIRRIQLGKALQSCVIDALFSMGIMKVGIAPYQEGFLEDTYRPFARPVDLDDWVHDMYVKRFDQIGFCGHRFRIPLWQAKENDYYFPAAREKLKPTPKTSLNESGDTRADAISQGEGGMDREELQDYVELWELWLPEENQIVTMNSGEDRAVGPIVLGAVPWEGPRSGPYKLLSFQEVPSSVMPSPPVSHWTDIDYEANLLANKVFRQANRQKSHAVGRKGTGDDAEKIKNTADGEIILLNDPQGFGEVSWGGPNGPNLALMMQLRQLFSYFANNLDSLGGLMSQAETATQEELISAQSSETIASMQRPVAAWIKEICTDLSVWELTDPMLERQLTKRLPGTSIELPFTLTPQRLEGRFEDFDYEVEPYSYVFKTPGRRLADLTGALNILAPFLPLFQQQGTMLDVQRVVSDMARYGDMPELQEWFVQLGPSTMPEGESGMPAVTKRQYERTSRPGQNMAGREQAMISALLSGGGDNQSQSVMRQAG